LTASHFLEAAVLLQRIADHARHSAGDIPAELRSAWSDVERQLLHGLRLEERALSAPGTASLRELTAIASNERIRNLVWEVTISIELQKPRVGGMLTLANLLRARAQARPDTLRPQPMSSVG
jgi:hypothetical protein